MDDEKEESLDEFASEGSNEWPDFEEHDGSTLEAPPESADLKRFRENFGNYLLSEKYIQTYIQQIKEEENSVNRTQQDSTAVETIFPVENSMKSETVRTTAESEEEEKKEHKQPRSFDCDCCGRGKVVKVEGTTDWICFFCSPLNETKWHCSCIADAGLVPCMG